MKNPYSPCKNAAERVKYLFSHYSFFLKQKLTFPTFSHSHHCNLLKLPRLSSKVGNLSLLGYEIRKGRKEAKKFSAVKENKKSLSPIASGFNSSKGSELKSERVQSWKLKEQAIASRKLKSLKEKQNQGSKVKHKISLMQDAKKTEESNQLEHWENFIRAKEERHFNITRITKYLMD
jgi:hypothetical protein